MPVNTYDINWHTFPMYVCKLIWLSAIYAQFDGHICFRHIFGNNEKHILQLCVFWHKYAKILGLYAHCGFVTHICNVIAIFVQWYMLNMCRCRDLIWNTKHQFHIYDLTTIGWNYYKDMNESHNETMTVATYKCKTCMTYQAEKNAIWNLLYVIIWYSSKTH